MLSREYMIREIKKHKSKDGKEYIACKIRGGMAPLEIAPIQNVYGFYRSVCLSGRRKEKQQLEFQFV